MKRVSNEGITLAGATSRGVSAKKWRGRLAETILFAETSREKVGNKGRQHGNIRINKFIHFNLPLLYI
jgi:hypothetical protein